MRVQRADGRSHKQLAALCLFQPLSRLAATAPRSGSLLGGTMCQDIRVNTPVGTRSPYSLPFVILPVPARSPFRLLVHRTRSTPNPVWGAFWCALQSHPFTRLWRISHGEAIFHCASAQFHPAQAGFHCGRKSALPHPHHLRADIFYERAVVLYYQHRGAVLLYQLLKLYAA